MRLHQKLHCSNVAAFRYHSFIHLFDQIIGFSIICLCIMCVSENRVSSDRSDTVCSHICSSPLHVLNFFLMFEIPTSNLLFLPLSLKWSYQQCASDHDAWIQPHFSSLTLSGCGSGKQEVAFAEVCITLHFSLPKLLSSKLHWCSRLRVFCCNIPVISERQAWKRIYGDLCSTCWEDVIELSCSSLLF